MKLRFLIRYLPISRGFSGGWCYNEGIPFIVITNNLMSGSKTRHDLDTLYFSGDESEKSLKSKSSRLKIYELKKL